MAKEATRILLQASGGDQTAVGALLPLIYKELRALAATHLERENSNHTLAPTELVHEVYMRLIDDARVDWNDKAHFMALASQAMRRILVEHARARRAGKRGGNWHKVTLDRALAELDGQDVDVQELDGALDRLSALHERQGRVVEMRFFAGMTIRQVAEVLSVSASTIEADWRTARAWLRKELRG